ncbi:P-loop containing nucleoside triphosphate hydrolase protein [Phascolomyces articulosus]|uniref:P-loop containing nucleoside triphosphate hydrolase protein n=1 Tax=Phascolomyces articulosus TaxID=60185 RepID=A0AAD5KB01_9FUNG|nr:P-loop containing nucleoside triphosphate hydrolase protein [Phascolomyces articulosus]
MATTAVRVALRVRPLNSKEQAANYQECITFATDEPQIFLGSDRAFTFDNVFKPDSTQQDVYNKTVVPLVDRFIEGNNVTILAYGQTGSGKTYSMGTGIDIDQEDGQGVVQRFAHQLFDALEKSNTKSGNGGANEDSFQVYVSFLELYHEDLNDLLEPHRDTAESHPSIREALDGSIYWAGVREERVYNAQELLGLLQQGATFRATGSTDVNAASSRSHAVFSVLLKQQLAEDNNSNEINNNNAPSIDKLPIMKRIASKFHFVDLAGSERLKRTMGDRQKEGISINTGLLALGNVISALGDEARKGSHVPYRDSKLTRLLQDSLGGNSHTLMLACVSPADADYMKTLNTLKYAGRARNIQNRVEINHDYEGSPDELQFLRTKLSQLKMQMSILQKVQNHHHQHPSSTFSNMDPPLHHDPLFIPQQQQYDHQQQREELARMRQYNQETSAELARIQSERDTLLAQISPDHVISEAHPVIRQYAETVEALKLQLSEAHHRLASLNISIPPPSSVAANATVNALPKNPASPTMVSTSTITYGNTTGPSEEELYPSQSTAVPGRYGTAATTVASSSSTSIDHRDNIRTIYRPVVTLSGRRQKRPIAQRMKTHSRKRGHGGDSTNHSTNTSTHTPTTNTTTTTEKLIHMMELTNGSEFNAESTYPFNSHGRQRKSQDETVIQDLSGVETRTTKASDLFLCPAEERDRNGNSEFNTPTRTRTMDQDPFIHHNDESGTSSSSIISCGKIDDFDDSDGELEALAVPTWTNAPRAAQSTNGSTKRESLSWTDSLLDDSDNSIATSRLSSSWTSSSRQHGHSAQGSNSGTSTAGRRRSKDLLKMLHQVQADLLVKKELVGQLEKSEDEYTQMRSTYEDKLNELHEHLMETEKERDDALLKQPGSSRRRPLNNGAATIAGTTNYTRRTAAAATGRTMASQARGIGGGERGVRGGGGGTTPPPTTAAPNVMQLRETRQVDDVRRLFEQKLKKLSTENQELKRKYTQTNHTLQTARAKAETFVSKMQSEIDTLKLEKKQLQKAAKMEADKSRDRIAQYERDIQVLKRREIMANDNRKKWEEAHEYQEQLLKRRNDEVASMATQLRQWTTSLRRAATEGVVLNEVSLDRILNTSTSSTTATTTMMNSNNQRATKSPIGRRTTTTPTLE